MVKDLELGPWCIQCLSVLELEGWQSPPSSRKFLKLNAGVESLDFPGIYRFLQSSFHLETLVIDWYNYRSKNLLTRYTDEDEHSGRFETHNFNCSLRHLKTIEFINFHGALSDNKSILPLVKYLLKSTTVLEKFVIAAILEESDASQLC
ncbi:uncharacterized protein LOC132606516 isoform X2 [Lycium barbarum]|uniref:uncharacterized protein LOC132606516 isoform X2 n=1 Tax=Lycium barbarum TaxID=112863 RepID=UPI00293E8BFE|nr:uncharacterized protein LOC132606516 isoform X2 [Lycium barbarum]